MNVPAAPDSLPAQPWRTPARGRRPLTTELIVGAALEVLDSDGLDGVTMRKVAERLDTGAASLYAHVKNKSDLHELILDAVVADLTVPEPDPQRWQRQAKQLALDLTATLAARPGIARIALETLIPTTPNALDLMNGFLGVLRASGMPDEDVLAASDVLALYTAAGAYEQSMRTGERAAADARERIGLIGQYLKLVPEGRLPHLIALAPAMARQGQEGFELGLDLLIDGLAARSAR